MSEQRAELEAVIDAALAEHFPEVELVDLEIRGGGSPTLTLFVDRPGGVDLDLCAAVSQAFDDLRERYALEVSSPGLDRRLRKPGHYAAALGRDVGVRLEEPLDGRRNFRGVLQAADETSITLAVAEGGVVVLPLAGIAKAHVVYNHDTDGGHRE